MTQAPVEDSSLRAELRRRVQDWQGLIGREPDVARQILRQLMVGRLTLTPTSTATGRGYEIRRAATYGPLFAGLPCVVGFVPPG